MLQASFCIAWIFTRGDVGFFCFFFSRAYRCELSASQSLQMSVLRVCVSVCVYFWRLGCNSLSSASGWRGMRGTILGFGCSFKDATHRSGFRAQINEGTPLRMTLVSWFLFFSSFFCLAENSGGKMKGECSLFGLKFKLFRSRATCSFTCQKFQQPLGFFE